MSTTTPIIVRSVQVDAASVRSCIEGGLDIILAVKLPDEADDPGDPRDPIMAWDAFVKRALLDAAPEIADVLRRAVERKLPWTLEAQS